MTKSLKPVDVIETPDHFYYGGIDIPYATCEKTKVEKITDGMVKVTKSFIVNSYTYQESMNPFSVIDQKKIATINLFIKVALLLKNSYHIGM